MVYCKKPPKQRKMKEKDKIITALNLIEHMGIILEKEKERRSKKSRKKRSRVGTNRK